MLADGLRLRGCLVLAALLACSAVEQIGRAQPAPRVALAWGRSPAAAACASREVAVGLVQRRLKRPPFTEGQADFLIDARLDQPARDRWEVTFLVSRADGAPVGRRTLAVDAPSCRVLDGPMALVLTLLAEAPERASEGTAPAPSTPAPTEPLAPAPAASSPAPAPPAPPAASSAPPPTPAPPSTPLSGSLFLAALASQGAVPGLGPGARLGATLGAGRLRARAEASYEPGATTPSEGPGVRVSLAQVGLAGCARSGAALGPLQVEGCAGLRVGMARGSGSNLSSDASASVLVHGLTTQAALRWPLGPLALRGSLGLQVATARARFFYDTPTGTATPWRASLLQPEAELALEFRWGP